MKGQDRELSMQSWLRNTNLGWCSLSQKLTGGKELSSYSVHIVMTQAAAWSLIRKS